MTENPSGTISPLPPGSSLPPAFHHFARRAALVGAIALAACAIAWIVVMIFGSRWPLAASAFYKAYLVGWLFFVGLSLGALTAAMTHNLTGGQWGYFVRRGAEAGANILPLLFILFVPILVGLPRIYPWADPHRHSAVIIHKAAYLNTPFFILRYFLYFAAWIIMAWRLRALSLQHDQTPEKRLEKRLERWSAAGLVVYFVTMSLASVDWIMSLEPQWFSTVFGFIVCMSQAVAGTCVLTILLYCLRNHPPIAPRLRPKHFNDMATLLITAVILWAYMSFAQLLVVWMGNLQSEIPWYVQRSYGPWRTMSLLLVYAGFLAPFILLLQRSVKNNGKVLSWVCAGILLMQALDIFWWVTPSGVEPYPEIHWVSIVMTLLALIGIGGVWIAAFVWLLGRAPLMPGGKNIPIALVGDEIAPSGFPVVTDLPHGKVEHGNDSEGQPGIA